MQQLYISQHDDIDTPMQPPALTKGCVGGLLCVNTNLEPDNILEKKEKSGN